MFQFPAQLTIVQVEACRVALLDEINNSDVVEFDDSAVERIDTLGFTADTCRCHLYCSAK